MRHTGAFPSPSYLSHAIAAALTLCALPAFAADLSTPPSGAEQSPETATLQAVTVTATRRAEPLQQVPVAVTVLE